MLCPMCRFDNPEAMRFCGGCGSPLESSCPGCGFSNPPGFRFCGGCGSPIVAAQGDGSPAEVSDPQADRRQLTVMFCDLVGSTALSDRLDPEELREVVRSYQAAAGEVVDRYGGYVAQYLGDGMLVYFGYPVAHENDVQRAVHTALGILDALGGLNLRIQREQEIRLSVRIGIHTGPVVTGKIGARERLALGQTPNLAARLQGMAEPGTVVLSAASHRLVRGFFTFAPLGPQILKGITQPVEVYRVLQPTGVRSAFELAITQGLTPAVGRSQEIAALLASVERLSRGGSEIALVTADAGFGKSRLIQMLRERTSFEPLLWLVCRCSPYTRNSALNPILDLLQDLFRFRPGDSEASKLGRLHWGLARLRLPTEQGVPLLADFLSVPLGQRYEPLGLSPQRRKERTFELLLACLARLAEDRPVVLVVEDLHWVDPSTLELLHQLVETTPARILIILTARRDFPSPWPPGSKVAEISLGPLSPSETRDVVLGIAAGRKLPPEVLRHIVDKTDGVPLFIEELTKMMLESGLLREGPHGLELSGPLPMLDIPATLQDSLTARLDRLGGGRELVQVSSVLGREFTYELIRAVSRLEEGLLAVQLARLVKAELLFQQGEPPEATYVFKHALIQDTAYGSLLKSQRRVYHHRIAEILLARFFDVAAVRPELLAHHYTLAELPDPAIRYWLQAGTRALERSANHEAIDLFQRALALIEELPEGVERDRLELEIQAALGPALIAIKGYSAPEVNRVYARAHDLSRRIGDAPRLFGALWGLGVYNLVLARLDEDYRYQILHIAEIEQDPVMLLGAYFGTGCVECFRGEILVAHDSLEKSLTFDSPDRTVPQVWNSGGDDAGVAALCFSAFALWARGHPDQALRRSGEAIELARRIAHPYSLAFALTHCAFLFQFLREGEAVRSRAGEAAALSEEKGFLVFAIMGGFVLGWAQEEAGEPGGLERMLACLAAWRGAGARIWEPYFLCLLAEVQARRGSTAEALALIDEALAAISRSSEAFWLAELYRLQGEIRLASGEEEEAERSFQQALAVAREQGFRAFELRSSLSLARLRAA